MKTQALEYRLLETKSGGHNRMTKGSMPLHINLRSFSDPNIEVRTMYKPFIRKSDLPEISHQIIFTE